MLTDLSMLALVAGTFLLAGFVKGVVGLGLPAVSLGILTATIGLPPAMAILLIPSFATNLWQAVDGGHGRMLLRTLWPFLVPAVGCVWLGAHALRAVDIDLLAALLGLLLVIYASFGLLRPSFRVSRRNYAVAVICGLINGVLSGMTGSFVVPGAFYLQAIGLTRDQLVQAMGIVFTASTTMLAFALGGQQLLTWELGVVSGIALVPALAGMAIGQVLRRRLSESGFRRVFLLSLLVLGGYILVRSLSSL
ncbi:MAG: sulfite exporter TauE/SafE family protein [Alphaproteobacteria bacterium]